MTKSFLIATVAALAIIVPAQAQSGDRQAKAEERAEKAKERAQAQRADRGKQRASRAEARPQASERRQQRVSREQARPQAAERRQQRVSRAEAPPQASERRQQRVSREQARPQASERRQQRVRADRPQVRERVRAQQPRERVQVERRTPRAETRNRSPQRVERRSPNVDRARSQRAERQRVERQQTERQPPARTVQRNQNRAVERRAIERRSADERRSRTIETRNTERFEAQQLRQRQQQERVARAQNRIERREDRLDAREVRRARQALVQRPSKTVGDRLNVSDRQVRRDQSDGYFTQRFSRRYDASPQYRYYHDYDDGYLYRVRRDTNVVTAALPLLGGAFSVGQALPIGYSTYNVPNAYSSLYYDTPNYRYRYGDGAIYRVDSSTLLIQAVVALLTGQSLGVGQMLPVGYDVYNVPYSYRDRYVDTDDMWYRYNDGYIYGVDPYTRRIQTMYPISYGGYAVGYPVPSYASYGGYTGFGSYSGYPGYTVPYGYNSLYHTQPGYNYHYANGGIYQIDPATRIITALVALVTGANLGVGQMLPVGYEVYNVPYAYRSSYFDTEDAWYRYDDGHIYQVDPRSRLIQASIPVAYDGYVIGQPVPVAYPGYPVPDHYSSLYYAQPGYDYRYFDGGIYQIDPTTRVVQALVALLTGQTLGVGQMLPAGYDVYNVPYDYRDRYHDTDRFMYRYADGYIYQVDPQTRLIQKVINAVA